MGSNDAEITIQSMKVYKELRKDTLLRNNNRGRENNLPHFSVADSDQYAVDDDYLYDEDYENNQDLINKIPLHMIKSFSSHKNKTYFKYTVNKSNRLLKKGDSLQRINGNCMLMFFFFAF